MKLREVKEIPYTDVERLVRDFVKSDMLYAKVEYKIEEFSSALNWRDNFRKAVIDLGVDVRVKMNEGHVYLIKD